jgi:competence protein ComEC
MSTESERRPKFVAPLVPLALAVAAGIAVDRSFEPCGTFTWAAIALGVVAAIEVGARRDRRAWDLALRAAFVAIGGGWHHHCWSDVAADDLARRVSERPRPAWVRGVLREVLGKRPGAGPGDPGATRAVLELTGICDGRLWQPASGRAQLFIAGDRTDLRAGEPVEAAGALARPEGPLNPGEFDFRNYLRAQGIRLRLSVDDPQSVWRDPAGTWWPWTRRLGAVRAWSQARLVGGLDARIAPLAAALVLGRREGVDPDVNDAFARTGTTHLLAISGLHLQVLAGVLWFAFRALGLGRRGAFSAVALATIAYALLVGLAPSVVRSAAMTVTYCLACLFDRKARPANTLALAALATLALNPAYLFDVGCQLSFLAVAAIVWGANPVSAWLKQPELSPLDALERKYEPKWRKLVRRGVAPGREGLIISVVVWLAAWPLVALRFHLISPIRVLLNVPLVPLTSIALLACGLALGLSAVWSPLGVPAAWVGSLCLHWTEAVVRWGLAQQWGHGFVPEPSWAWVLGFYGWLGLATAAGAGRWTVRRWTWGALGAWIVLGLGLAWAPRRLAALEAEVLAVGHGLAVVVQAPNGRAFVYDCGRMRDPSIGRRVIAPVLWARGVRRIEAVILSHADADHYNGLPDLLDRFAIGAVRVTSGFGGAANPEAVRLLAMVRARGVPIETIAEGERWEAAGARFAVWHPPEGWHPNAKDNARSLVIDLESEGRHALLTGDLEEDGLVQIMSRPRPTLDVFLAPHHGGRTANPGWFYLWASPAQVIVSQRPPAPGTRDALAPLAAQGVPLLRTWQRGAIRLGWTKNGITARGFLDEAKIKDQCESSNLTFSMIHFPFTIYPAWSHGLVAVLGFGLGLWLCLTLAVIEWGAWALVAPGRRLGVPEPDAVLGVPIEARGFDGVRLAGLWHPAEPRTERTILLVHGFAEDPSSLHSRVEALVRHGWNVATLDQRGHGRSGGSRASFGGRESDDLRAWIDVLAGRVGPALHPAAWGRSMGAAIATRATADDPRIVALVLEAPYLDLEAAIGGWLRRLRVPLTGLFARLIARRAEALAGVSLTRPRPLDLAPCIAAPVLIVHGEKDSLIPLADAQRLAGAFPRPAAVIDVTDAGHTNIIDVGGPALLDRIAAFLDEALTA